MNPLFTGRRLLPAVMIALGLLFATTTVVTRAYHQAKAGRAARLLAAGRAAAATGRAQEAVAYYRAALLDARGDATIEWALAQGLLSLGRSSEAESYIRDLLLRYPINGSFNLALARIEAHRGADAAARRLYQVAIYGAWTGDDAAARRIDARFEWLGYLRTWGRHTDVLAELLRLDAELPPARVAARRRVAAMLTEAGAIDLALASLNATVASAPPDTALLVQLASVQRQAGRSADARATLRLALMLDGGRDDLRNLLAEIDRELALDPTLPRLRLSTRAQRARQLLRAVAQRTGECPAVAAQDARALAAERLRRRAGSTVEAAEEDLAIAARLWSLSEPCHGDDAEARAIDTVVARVTDAPERQP